ncbi:MAG: zinc ribbon domain-containing protein [Promethearchaeota archaeon]|nr:MAG: zinc ribbon domain-containing protein [Candidatus Lokiarchaeota archaeon]
MFCPNCGERYESQNQKFCTNCGSELSNIFDAPQTPQLRVEENQASSTVRSIPVYESKSIKVGGPGPNSKMCFAFAIVSIALAIAGFIFGGNYFFRYFIYSLLPYYPGGLGLGIVGLIIAIALNIGGLIFAILSRVNSSKAGKNEPRNTLEQFGSVVAVFGIIMNIIPIVITPLIFLGISFLTNAMPMYY